MHELLVRPKYILSNYIEDAHFSFHIWNHIDSIGDRPRTSNHIEGDDIDN